MFLEESDIAKSKFLWKCLDLVGKDHAETESVGLKSIPFFNLSALNGYTTPTSFVLPTRQDVTSITIITPAVTGLNECYSINHGRLLFIID